MHPSAWAAVLRHIPAEQHHQFSIVTASGTEITIASLLRIEDDFVVLKGRLSGSQDAGRVFFLPYANIDYFGFTNPVKDEDFNALFGNFNVPQANAEAYPAPAAQPYSPGPPPAHPSMMAPPPPARASVMDRPAIRSEVLERFRSRPSSQG